MRDRLGNHHCTWCGSSLPERNRTGRYYSHCSVECVGDDLRDAQKTRDECRAANLYSVRASWRRRLGVPSMAEAAE